MSDVMNDEHKPGTEGAEFRDTNSDHDSMNDSLNDEMSLYVLFDTICRDFDVALDEKDGWAWVNVDITIQLHNIITRLRHWKTSLHWLAVKYCGADPSEDTDVVIRQLLKAVEEDNYFLASVLRKYLDEVYECLGNLHIMHLDPTEQTGSSGLTIPVEDLETAVKHLGLQLRPLSAFARARVPISHAHKTTSTATEVSARLSKAVEIQKEPTKTKPGITHEPLSITPVKQELGSDRPQVALKTNDIPTLQQDIFSLQDAREVKDREQVAFTTSAGDETDYEFDDDGTDDNLGDEMDWNFRDDDMYSKFDDDDVISMVHGRPKQQKKIREDPKVTPQLLPSTVSSVYSLSAIESTSSPVSSFDNKDVFYRFEPQYQRHACLRLNRATGQWEFSHWMPQGFQPPQKPVNPQPAPSYRYDSAYKLTPVAPFSFGAGATRSSGSWAAAGAAQYGNPTIQWSSPPLLQQHIPYAGGSNYASAPNASPPQNDQYQPRYNPPNTSSGFALDLPTGKGDTIFGTYGPKGTLKYEKFDRSFYVRNKAFFFEGRVFAVIMNETAGETARGPTDYNPSWSEDRHTKPRTSNPSISAVKYEGHLLHTQKRRFVVVRQRKEYCYCCPIFTYSGRATTKRGIRAWQHGIAYSIGQGPELLPGETGITKRSIGVVMAAGELNLEKASRIYYGIHHPIQYNVKIKEIGMVHESHIASLIGNWKEEDGKDDDSKRPIAEEFEKIGDPFEDAPDPHSYEPQTRVYGFHPDINPHMYHPAHNPYGYHPENNQHGYHPESNQWSYHPKHNSYGYHPTKAPFCFHPHFSPFGYSQQNLQGYHPTAAPYNYHPDSNPLGYNPTHNMYGYHPQYNKDGYHQLENPDGYHPTLNSVAYHPEFNPGEGDNHDEDDDDESDDDGSDEENPTYHQ